MKLNWAEKAAVNNPFRAALQRHVEARWLHRHGGEVRGGRVLEIGCGQGVGTEIILDRFAAGSVDAFDLDPAMVALARRRLGRCGGRVRLFEGSATQIAAPDAHYDAVFDFAIIHHIPNWRAAIREAARVLKPGGRFFAEEIYDRFIQSPIWRRVFEHPQHDRFGHTALRAELEANGLRVVADIDLYGQAGAFVAEKSR